MTVTSTTSEVSYTGNGVTTAFAVPFRFADEDHLVVTKAGVLQTLTTHYTVSGGSPTGTVTFLAAPANGAAIVISRDTPYTQETAFRSQGDFSPRLHEDALDKLTMQLQDAERATLDAEDRLDALEAADVALDTRLDAAEATLTSHTTTLSSHASTLATHTSQVSALQAADTSLDSRVDSLETWQGEVGATAMSGSATLSATILAGKVERLDVTVSGADIGTRPFIVFSDDSYFSDELVVGTPVVTAADTVSVMFFNPTSNPITVGPMTINIRAFRT